MGMSDRRKKDREKRKALKEARIKSKPASQSKYALKQRGQYSPTSPYVTGNWGQRCRKLREQPPIAATPHCRGWRFEPEVEARNATV